MSLEEMNRNRLIRLEERWLDPDTYYVYDDEEEDEEADYDLLEEIRRELNG